jgi:hypothetical protein
MAKVHLLCAALLLSFVTPPLVSASPGVARGWRAYPNPFTTRFRVELPDNVTPSPGDPEGQVRVFDTRGHLVRDWVVVINHEIGIDWDGRTNSGAVAPSGWYIFDIWFHNLGLKSVRFKMLRIRGTLSSTYDWQWH